MTCPPKGIVHAAWDEEVGPFEQDAGFQEHDNVSIQYVVGVNILNGVNIVRRHMVTQAYIENMGEILESNVPLVDEQPGHHYDLV